MTSTRDCRSGSGRESPRPSRISPELNCTGPTELNRVPATYAALPKAHRVINTDLAPTYPRAIVELQHNGTLRRRCRHRPVQYLNNIIEQDHRFIKKRVNAKQGFRAFGVARRTIQGYEAMHAHASQRAGAMGGRYRRSSAGPVHSPAVWYHGVIPRPDVSAAGALPQTRSSDLCNTTISSTLTEVRKLQTFRTWNRASLLEIDIRRVPYRQSSARWTVIHPIA